MSAEPRTDDAPDVAETLNTDRSGYTDNLGLRFVRATRHEVVAELTVEPKHQQIHGIVHGGVYCSMIETVTSVGASLDVGRRGDLAVGLENHTSFLHAVREGVLRAVATPVETGRRTQLWQANVYDSRDRVVASGRVRLFVIAAESQLAGQAARLQ